MIRAAGPDDIPAILSIWNRAIAETTATFTTVPRTHADIAAVLGDTLVSSTGGKVDGFVVFGPFRAGPGYGDVVEHSVYVDRVGQGVGAALMQALERHLVAQHKRIMVAAIGGENTAGIAFHTAQGFVRVGRMPGLGQKFGRRHDLVLMQKELHTPH